MLRRLRVRSVCAVFATAVFLGCASEAPAPAADEAPAARGTPPDAPTSTPAVADGTPRVVFLGTSLTAGLGLRRPEDRWPERLGQLADSAGLPIQVVNAGRSGDTSAGGLARLDWLLEEPVDLLVVELGANDGLRGQPPAALADNLREIVERTRAAWPGAEILLVGMEAPTNLGPEYTARFREVFPAVASERDLPLVPFLLEGVAGVPELNQADRIHPTAEGHDRMARTVWPHLEPLLRRVQESPS